MDKKHFIITIGRQYGSGGRTVGKMLAKELGIHFYDEEILKMTSETSAIGEQYFRLADEKAGNNLLFRIVKEMKPDLSVPKSDANLTTPENLFRFQSDVIRKLAAEETCIFAGRCADYVLEQENYLDELIRVFVYGNLEARVRRVVDVDKVDEKEALKRIKRIDKERKEYYRYFAGRDWMNMEYYDLPINSSRLEFEQMAVLIKDYIRLKGF
ncbi:MAG: cytidylate kinase-like family protein, partial [Lachnospiraceae bacterium]|nr:cytidylate kinase-like family protein [Lachnospiraceae bacterium]